MPSPRLRRGRPLSLLALIVAGAIAIPALAQQPLRLVVPFPPGGGTDRVARLLSPHLAEGLARPVVVENRPGADGTIGAVYVARADPDGSRLLLSNAALTASTTNTELKFDPQRDLRPILQLTASQHFLVVSVDLGARAVSDLRVLAERRPGGLNCGGSSGGSTRGCEGLRDAIGAVEVIRYQGMAPAMKALMSGEIDLMFAPREHLGTLTGSGRTYVLAAVTDQPATPPYERLPLLKETYPAIVLSAFAGIFAAAGTPDAVVRQYNREFNRILALPEVRATLKDLYYDIVGGSPEVLAKSLALELENQRQVTRLP